MTEETQEEIKLSEDKKQVWTAETGWLTVQAIKRIAGLLRLKFNDRLACHYYDKERS